jgi:GT2 family glycosyltransferase
MGNAEGQDPIHVADADVETHVDWVGGGAMMLRRAAFDAAGGFDERRFMYIEDVDLCRRIRAACWIVDYVPQAVVEHTIGGSLLEGTAAPLLHTWRIGGAASASLFER